MNKKQKFNLIIQFEDLSHSFDIVLNFSEDMLNFRPNPDAWTIKEHIAHCLDVDIANFHRYRWGITNPGTSVLSFDQKWTEKLNYQSSDVKLCINIIKLIRKFIADHLRSIINDEWSEYTYEFEKKDKLNHLPLFLFHDL